MFKNFPFQPGVYRMLNVHGEVLYVGKAKNLRKRLACYQRARDRKTQALIAQIANIEVTCTNSENEALLLESNLIKTLKPHYNIVFKDDKSYPYLLLSTHKFPRLSIFRGTRKAILGEYFGPFPHVRVVQEVLNLLQQVFQLRSCSDHYLRHRSRPCMQYQINRCSAPCVGYINSDAYAHNVVCVKDLLAGKNNEVVEKLSALMHVAAKLRDYESAARIRDQIAAIKKIQQRQFMVFGSESIDVVTLVNYEANSAINILQIRDGLVLWDKSYLIDHLADDKEFTTFLAQYYSNFKPPAKIITNLKLSERIWLQSALSEKFGQPLKIIDRARGVYRKWLTMSQHNAHEYLVKQRVAQQLFQQQFAELTHILGSKPIVRIECFDVSHTSGEATIASVVSFSSQGPDKKNYRYFNLKQNHADDYQALQEALMRRYQGLKNIPDLVLIDGGLGQLQIALQVCAKLKIQDVSLLAIAKGASRKNDRVYTRNCELRLAKDSAVLRLLARIRDEAHRFAIVAHRKKMLKLRSSSVLEDIKGLGKTKCETLLTQLGGLSGIKNADLDQLAQVKGIGKKLALYIYKSLHER